VKERRNQFYERLERTYKLCPSYDTKIILNDKDAKVGKEIWTGTAAGTYGLRDESSDNGTRLINYRVHQMFLGGHYWEDIIKMDLQEVGFGGIDWMDLAQDRDSWWALTNAVMNLRVP